MDPAREEEVLRVIRETLEKAEEDGFEEDRIRALLHRTELSLKYQVISISPFRGRRSEDS